jgi:ribosomal protein L11 methyltransferase
MGEIIIAELAEIGFESFAEEADFILAYIPQKDFSKEKLFSIAYFQHVEPEPGIKRIEDQNWNAVWESNYPAVTIAGKCHVRAPFHEKNEAVDFDILLNPKMAFGTAHHETTALMLAFLLEEDCKGKQVLDMGCGTGVLAILAEMKGASGIDAIDNDEWSYNNSLENIGLNNCKNINVKLGDADMLETEPVYDLILANINKNILLKDIRRYAKVLKEGGRLFLSGFYTEDLEDISREAKKSGLEFVTNQTKNNWVAMVFKS